MSRDIQSENSNGYKAVFGEIIIPRAYCPSCRRESFVQDGRFNCCGENAPFVSDRFKIESPAVGKRKTAKAVEVFFTCPVCGDPTPLKTASKKFCSPRCRAEFHDRKRDPRLSQLVTTSQAARLLGVSVSTVRLRIRNGSLTAHRLGNLLLIHRSSLSVAPVLIDKMSADIAARLYEFAKTHGLSTRSFGRVCGCSTTTARRMWTGDVASGPFESRRFDLRLRLIRFLTDRGISDSTATAEIDLIFN